MLKLFSLQKPCVRVTVVRNINSKDQFFTITKFRTSPLYIVRRTLLTMRNCEVGNFVMVKNWSRLCHSMSVCPACPSVCDVQVPWSHRLDLEYFENNFTAEYLKVYTLADPNMGDQGQPTGTHQNYGGIWEGSSHSWAQKPAISPKRCKIGPRFVWRTNRKSHTRFRLVPKSMTLDDLERPKRTLAKKRRFTEHARKKIEWR